jgi:hypothetical protein
VVIAGEVVCNSSDRGLSWADVALPTVGSRPSTASALAVTTPDRVFVGTVLEDVFRIDRRGWGLTPGVAARPSAMTTNLTITDILPATLIT